MKKKRGRIVDWRLAFYTRSKVELSMPGDIID